MSVLRVKLSWVSSTFRRLQPLKHTIHAGRETGSFSASVYPARSFSSSGSARQSRERTKRQFETQDNKE